MELPNENVNLAEIDGKVYTLGEVSRKFDIPRSTITQRYYSGKRDKDLIRPAPRRVHINGKDCDIWEQFGIGYTTTLERYERGHRGKEIIQASQPGLILLPS